jgi:hypothetical protein
MYSGCVVEGRGENLGTVPCECDGGDTLGDVCVCVCVREREGVCVCAQGCDACVCVCVCVC